MNHVIQLMKTVFVDAFEDTTGSASVIASLTEVLDEMKLTMHETASDWTARRKELGSTEPRSFFVERGFLFNENFFAFKKRPIDSQALAQARKMLDAIKQLEESF